MSDQDNAFTTIDKVDNATKSTESNSNAEDLLAGIKNEAGAPKYDSVEKALNSVVHSQKHIAELEAEAARRAQEIKELRETVSEVSALKEVVEKLTAQPASKPDGDPTPVSAVDPEFVSKLVQEELNQRDVQLVANTNLDKVAETLKAKYGEKTQEVINAKALELGTTAEELGNLARKNPNMVLAVFNSGSGPVPGPTSPSGTIPLTPTETKLEAPKPGRSLLQGASSTEVKNAFAASKEYTNRRLGVET